MEEKRQDQELAQSARERAQALDDFEKANKNAFRDQYSNDLAQQVDNEHRRRASEKFERRFDPNDPR